jgi:ankyrin repeat protein
MANPPVSPAGGATLAALNEALMVAAEGNHVEKARALVAKGADPDFENETGDSPLMMAVMRQNREMVDFLLNEAGAKPDKFIATGLSAVHMAVNKSNLGIAKLLVEAGARLDVTGDHGLPAHELATTLGKTDIADYLARKFAEQALQKAKEETTRRVAKEIAPIQKGLTGTVCVRKPLKIQPRANPGAKQ